MMSRVALAVVLAACLLFPASSRAFDDTIGKERIGARVGGVDTFDGLSEAYGSGWEFTLFFNERLTHHLLINLLLGALYMGEPKDTTRDDEVLHRPGVQTSMRLLYITLGPSIGTRIGGAYSVDLSAGAGIYSVSQKLDNELSTIDLSQQKFGFNGGIGIARRLSTNWSIDANSTVHYFLINKNQEDIYFAFTNGADPPIILDVSLGVVLDLR